MKKKETKEEFKDCETILSYINTRKMPKVVKEQFERDLDNLCQTTSGMTIDIYQRYNQYNK